MTDADDHEDHDGHVDTRLDERQTAPQSPYTTRRVGIGAIVTFVGIAVAYLLPNLLL